MHPEQICKDFKQLGSQIVLDNGEVFIENPEKAGPELMEVAKEYKSRIKKYLQGSYSKKEHSLRSTIDKIVAYMLHVEQEMNNKITAWLRHDHEALQMIMKLLQLYFDNGWRYEQTVANFETTETDKLSQEIFDRAMAFFKGA